MGSTILLMNPVVNLMERERTLIHIVILTEINLTLSMDDTFKEQIDDITTCENDLGVRI